MEADVRVQYAQQRNITGVANETPNAVLFFADKTFNKMSAYKPGGAGYGDNTLASGHFSGISGSSLLNPVFYTLLRPYRMIWRTFPDFCDRRFTRVRGTLAMRLYTQR